MKPESREFVASARKFMAQFKGFFGEVEELEKLDQLVLEAQSRLRLLGEQETEARTAIERLYADADIAIAEKHATAAREIADKHRRADELVATAEDNAARILRAAREEAAGFAQQVEDHKTVLAEHSGILTKLKADIVEHAQARDAAHSEANTARQQLLSEKTALRAFRASLPQ